MKCHVCDKTLSDKEVQWNRDHQDWDPCGTCLEVINNLFEHPSEEEIDEIEFDHISLEEIQDIINEPPDST